MKWNCRSLLRACEALLARDDCTLSLVTIQRADITARMSYSWRGTPPRAKDIRLTVDPAASSLVEGFLHEALHVVLVNDIDLKFTGPLEEAIVTAVEQHLWRKTMRREDLARWRKLIHSKLR